MVAVAVGLVEHDLAFTDTFVRVDHPEDDTSFACGSKAVIACSVVHLSLTEYSVGKKSTAEGAACAQAQIGQVLKM